tara:strand:- start:275 stop:1414 length:1140 start_codon:yes stop_codon:yes gene_type:complete
MNQIAPRVIRQLFILLLILLLGVLIFLKLVPYLSGVLGAVTLYVLLKKLMTKMTQRNWNETLSVTLLLVGSFILILLPLFGTVYMLSSKISKVIKNSERFLEAIKNQVQFFESKFNYDFSTKIDTDAITSWLSSNLQNLASSTFDVFIAISIMYFLLYFMLTNQNKLKLSMESYLPISRANLGVIIKEAKQKVKANAIGIPLVALVQGIIAFIGYLIFGVSDPLFWFVVTAVGSVIPFIGTAIGIIPVTVILLSQGLELQALGMLIYGVVVVGASDNIIRLLILKRMADEHPLITLFGVIIGIPLFGFIGLIFGPLMISLFLLLVKLYKKEYVDNAKLDEEPSRVVVINQNALSQEQSSEDVDSAEKKSSEDSEMEEKN